MILKENIFRLKQNKKGDVFFVNLMYINDHVSRSEKLDCIEEKSNRFYVKSKFYISHVLKYM